MAPTLPLPDSFPTSSSTQVVWPDESRPGPFDMESVIRTLTPPKISPRQKAPSGPLALGARDDGSLDASLRGGPPLENNMAIVASSSDSSPDTNHSNKHAIQVALPLTFIITGLILAAYLILKRSPRLRTKASTVFDRSMVRLTDSEERRWWREEQEREYAIRKAWAARSHTPMEQIDQKFHHNLPGRGRWPNKSAISCGRNIMKSGKAGWSSLIQQSSRRNAEMSSLTPPIGVASGHPTNTHRRAHSPILVKIDIPLLPIPSPSHSPARSSRGPSPVLPQHASPSPVPSADPYFSTWNSEGNSRSPSFDRTPTPSLGSTPLLSSPEFQHCRPGVRPWKEKVQDMRQGSLNWPFGTKGSPKSRLTGSHGSWC